MKKTIILLLSLLFTVKAFSQSEPANYNAAVNKFKLFYNNDQPDSIYKMFGPEMKSALTFDQFKNTSIQLKAQVGTLLQITFSSFTQPVAVYKANFQKAPLSLSMSLNSENKIIGLLLQAVPAAPTPPPTEKAVLAEPVSTTDPSLTETPITIKTLSGTINGTLTTPKDLTGKVPVVLIIPGEGPIDRDGNSVKLGISGNTYKLLAGALGKNGIASVRYDKRVTPAKLESSFYFEDYVDDAVALISMLSDDPRFSKIIILGHSQGSLVGMLATHDQPVKAFISVSGTSDQADKLLTKQMKSKPQYLQDEFKALLDSMKKGKTIDNIDPTLYDVARPGLQHYLMTWCRYNPVRVIKIVKIPTLIIQGNADLQTGVTDAENLKKAKSDATLIIIPGMNFILKDAPADKDQNLATYTKPDLPVKPELITDIVAFINKIN